MSRLTGASAPSSVGVEGAPGGSIPREGGWLRRRSRFVYKPASYFWRESVGGPTFVRRNQLLRMRSTLAVSRTFPAPAVGERTFGQNSEERPRSAGISRSGRHDKSTGSARATSSRSSGMSTATDAAADDVFVVDARSAMFRTAPAWPGPQSRRSGGTRAAGPGMWASRNVVVGPVAPRRKGWCASRDRSARLAHRATCVQAARTRAVSVLRAARLGEPESHLEPAPGPGAPASSEQRPIGGCTSVSFPRGPFPAGARWSRVILRGTRSGVIGEPDRERWRAAYSLSRRQVRLRPPRDTPSRVKVTRAAIADLRADRLGAHHVDVERGEHSRRPPTT